VTLDVPLPTRRATKLFARALAAALEPGALVVLEGELGAGKTFAVRAVLRALGVERSVPVTSPTFTLVHEFGEAEGARLAVVHADLYRLGDARELRELGLADARREGACLLVEWGARFVGALGGDALVVTLEASGARRARVEAGGEGAAGVAERLSGALRW